jgi:hypothetical protein
MQIIGDCQILTRITLKWWENWQHVDLKQCKNKRVGGKSWCRRQRVMIRQSCGLRDLRIESTCATLAPSFGRPSRAPGRFAWIWTADSRRLSRNSFIHQSSPTDGLSVSQPDIMLEVESTIYRLIKRFPFFFFSILWCCSSGSST